MSQFIPDPFTFQYGQPEEHANLFDDLEALTKLLETTAPDATTGDNNNVYLSALVNHSYW